MARVRAPDYDTKLLGIVNAAATLFAKAGYSGVRMTQVAEACGVSKSMLYHYFATKDDLLFFMVKEHLEDLVDSLETVLAVEHETDHDSIHAFISEFVVCSSQARQRNIVLTNDSKYLSPDKYEISKEMQRTVLELVKKQLKRIKPDIDDNSLTAHAFFLIGILNWVDIWYNPKGPISPQQLANKITRQFLDGFSSLV